MKIATWNVNGIRAREDQLCAWMTRDQPDIVCLQELKAEVGQIPGRCNLVDYHVYCAEGLSRQAAIPDVGKPAITRRS